MAIQIIRALSNNSKGVKNTLSDTFSNVTSFSNK